MTTIEIILQATNGQHTQVVQCQTLGSAIDYAKMATKESKRFAAIKNEDLNDTIMLAYKGEIFIQADL